MSKQKDREVVFWEVGDKETLSGHKTIYDAIEAWIEQKYDPEQDPTKPCRFPMLIEVVGYDDDYPYFGEIERRTIGLVEYFCGYPDLVDGIVVKFESEGRICKK